MTPPAVLLRGLTKRFDGALAVRDLTLSITRGCTFGLLGVNGAGKSTTLKMMMGLVPSDEGTARLCDIDVALDPVRLKGRVGYVPEYPCVHRWMTVEEAVRFSRPLYRSWDDALARELLEAFALEPGKRVGALSKGMATKLHLLVALAHRPDVLLLDEPLSGLDPLVREEFTDGILRGTSDRSCTTVISSHQIADVQRLAERVGILHEGRLVLEESVEVLVGGTRRLDVVLAPEQGATTAPPGTIRERRDRRRWMLTVRNFTPAIVREIRERHRVQDVEVQELDLEEIFKDLVRGLEGA